MQSPFPGMDPYIESCGLWEEFHGHFIEKLYEALADRVPERYIVRTSLRSYVELVESEGKETRMFKGDVTVSVPTPTPGDTAPVAVADPITHSGVVSLRAFIAEQFREKFIEVYEPDEEGLRLVTCLEVLSPANKRKESEGWKQYSRKRQALLLGQANLVELDLLRGGHRMPMLDPWPVCPYTLLVCRQESAPTCRIFLASSLEPLPVLPVPLSSNDADVMIELQPLVDGIYARGRFHRAIDYTKPCKPSLPGGEAAWLEEQLKTRPAGAVRPLSPA